MKKDVITRVIEVVKNPSKLKTIPSLILGNVANLYHERINYQNFLKSGKKAIHGDLPYNLDLVQQQFADAGYKPVEYNINIESFNKYCAQHQEVYQDYKADCRDAFVEKALEHFVSLSFTSLLPSIKIIDIANAGSPFP